jgi:uncharacterized membrane protein
MRGRAIRLAVVLVCAAVLVAVLGGVAYAKSYSMSQVEILAEVAPDGSMLVTERRTFDFSGDYTFVYWELDKADAERVEVLGVAGPEGTYALTDDPMADDTRPPQTYRVLDYGTYYDVRAFFRAADTQHPVSLQYRVYGAAKRWQDTAELYWKFIGDRWELDSRNVRVHIVLPEGVTRDDVKAWAHGPLTGNVTLNDDGTVDLVVDRVPAYTFVEGRVAFPSESLPAAAVLDSPRLETILAEEDEWAQEANTERTVARVKTGGSAGVAIIVPLAALGWAFAYWRTHGKEYKPQFQGQYFRDLPADLLPGQVSALMNMGSPDDRAIPATIMDLIDRGVIAIERVTVDKKVLLGLGSKSVETYKLTRVHEKASGLAASEKSLLTLIFSKMADGDTITMEDLKATVKKQSKADEWGEGITTYKAKVVDEIQRLNLLEQKGGNAVGGFVALGVITIAVGMIPIMVAGNGCLLPWTILIGAVVIALGVNMKRRSPEAAELAAKYQAVRAYLKDFGRMQEKPPTSVILWRHFLTLAVVFGIADEVMKHLQLKVPEIMNDPMMGTWYWMTSPGSDGVTPMSALSSGVASVSSIATSNNSSSSGSGGGFSGGGGGGGGAG